MTVDQRLTNVTILPPQNYVETPLDLLSLQDQMSERLNLQVDVGPKKEIWQLINKRPLDQTLAEYKDLGFMY